MSTSDHPDRPTPSWPPALPSSVPPPLPTPVPILSAWDDSPSPEAAAEPARVLGPRTAWRAVRRHWWQILLLWMAGSAAALALVHARVKPKYESFALLQVEATSPAPFGPSPTSGGPTTATTLMETQVRLITTHDVLGAALKDETVANLPRMRQALDPISELRSELRTTIIPNSNLITVAMSSTDPWEAAKIINAVVDEYLRATKTRSDQQSRNLKQEFEMLSETLKQEVKQRKAALLELHGQGGIEPLAGGLDHDREGVRSADELRINEVTLEEYKGLSERLRDLDDKIYLIEGELIRRRAERPLLSQASDIDLDLQVQDALQMDPELTGMSREYNQAVHRLEEARRRTVKASDPARSQAEQEVKRLQAGYHELRARREVELRDRIARQAQAQAGPNEIEQAIRQGEEELERLKAQRLLLDDRLKELRVRSRDERVESLHRDIARIDFNTAQEKLRGVEKLLEQLDYEIGRNRTQIDRIAEARPTFLPTSNNRLAMMAAAPVGVLALVLGLFTLIEARAARVGDPEELPGRVRVGVIGVVPPLPSSRGFLGRNSPAKLQRQVEEFVQSLDHLRVVLCASARPGLSAGQRVVLITSACGSEGKTTLAAQLAGRCANAGLSTLLVDADLRRPRLAELLEVPDGLGLSDVLAGDAEPEAAMVVIGSAGGFHLLPAGSPGHDPSRLLQGDRLGQLMAQLRATFDVVIIDAPPVLAVPDALLVGRWTDGVVLAVRHDASRFPLVERANRRLAAVGIPVLGAVVNGVRSPDSAYSNYSYQYSYSDGSRTGDRPATTPLATDEI
ncbi:N/A [soil metagenome]